MRAVISDELTEERRRLGLDDRDEMWEGVLHIFPVAPSAHGMLWSDLGCLLGPPGRRAGLQGFVKPGLFDPQVSDMTSYRVPDLGYARREDVSERGIEGRAVLVVEVLSPGDESHEKLPFYRRIGVEELVFVDSMTKHFKVRKPSGDGWCLVDADQDGWTTLAGLRVALRRHHGRLQVRTDLGTEEV